MFPWQSYMTPYIAIGLMVYSALTTILLVAVCCCYCRKHSHKKFNRGRTSRSEKEVEAFANPIVHAGRRDTVLSLVSSTTSEGETTPSSFSNKSPMFVVRPSAIAVPMPSVPEINRESTDFESDTGSPVEDHNTNSNVIVGMSPNSIHDEGNTSPTRTLLQEEKFLENEPNTESHSKDSVHVYVNSDVSDENLCENSRPESSAYDFAHGKADRNNSLDSFQYERIDSIRRDSSIHDYQYVETKRKDSLSDDIYGNVRQSVALESIKEEENQNVVQYVNLQEERRSPSGTNYQSLGSDRDVNEEDRIKNEIEQGFYQGLADDAVGKYTNLCEENSNELGAQLENQISSHEESNQSIDAGEECAGQQEKSEYIYVPEYLALIHDDGEVHPKKELPIKYFNAEKSPGYMACITELKKKDACR